MKLQLDSIDLPVKDIIPEVHHHLKSEQTLIISAPPGAGKSTLVPLTLLKEPWLEGKKILMLEPRRIAARMIAARMASLLGEEVGQSVGYRIRLEKRVSEKTKIEVLTEGILMRMLQSNNALSDVGLVIFDEFHERSIHADVAMAFCREAQQVLRPDLRIMIMSATLDVSVLAKIFKAPVLESFGKQYPVEIKYAGEADIMFLPEMIARTVVSAVREHDGDALVFLPGEGEIKKCEAILRKNLPAFVIHPLYGRLPHSAQNRAIVPDNKGRRKVVLTTSIAETSLTIQGVKIVIDSGYGRTSKYDPRSGLSRLETVLISQDSAKQRAGRAGRLSPGICYRMWSKGSHAKRIPFRIPEILEADLTSLALDMAMWGVKEVNELTWVSPPPSGTLAQAYESLEQIGAVQNFQISKHGKDIHKLPCHPRIAHMLLSAKDEGLVQLACDLAAILEERDPLGKEFGIDINLRIEALRRFRSDKIGNKRFKQIEKVAASYRNMFGVPVENDAVNPYETGILLVFAYPERVACARPGNNAQFQLSNGRLAMAHHTDDLAHEAWLAVAQLDARDGIGKIFMASPLNPQDLAPFITQQESIKWDTRSGGLKAAIEFRIGNILLQAKPLPSPDEILVHQAVIEAIKNEGEQLLNFNDAVTQLQNRILSLRKWRIEEDWPDVSTQKITADSAKWIGPYLNKVRKNEDLEKLDLAEILFYHLTTNQQKKLEQFAPQKIKVPSGSAIKIQYHPDGAQAVLAVRLQEVFGLSNTPTVNGGKMAVLMHLLSPGFKLVQITSDLRSFWADAYFEVKKDLKRRYPKHSWPDNPLESIAVRGVKKR